MHYNPAALTSAVGASAASGTDANRNALNYQAMSASDLQTYIAQVMISRSLGTFNYHKTDLSKIRFKAFISLS